MQESRKNNSKTFLSIILGIVMGLAVALPISFVISLINQNIISEELGAIPETENPSASDNNTVSVDAWNDCVSIEDSIITDDSFPEYSMSDTASSDTVPEGTMETFESVDKDPTYLLSSVVSVDINAIPSYSGEAYYILNDNVPYFTMADLCNPVFEYYSELDNLGRCGVCTACIGTEIMPTEERGEIGSVKPSGWQTVKYPELINGLYLYNRCHLIAWCLAGENANTKNLITGTRYLNIEGMLSFENKILDYVKSTGNRVLYRVTPIFVDEELVARGVHMEGYSVEDNGLGICFNIFAYNVQPGITIDYATGDSCISEE